MKKKEKMWAIVGKYGLYVGTWLRRKDAILDHCKAKQVEATKEAWLICRRRGDRALKVEVSYEY